MLYGTNYKTSWRNLKYGINKGINNIQKENLLICESNAVPMKISTKLLMKFDKLIL